MSAFVYDLVLEEGEEFVLPMVYKPGGVIVDLTGYTAAMAVRGTFDTVALLELTHEVSTLGQILLGGADGAVTLTIKASATVDICAGLAGQYGVWDLFLFAPTGAPDKLVKGKVFGNRSATVQ